MLFKNDIYINENLLIKLSKQIGIKIAEESVLVNKNVKGAGIDIKPITINGETSTTNTQSIKNDKMDLYRMFESKILEDETGIIEFDFEEAEHIFSGQLIKFKAKMLQPTSENDNIELITSIKQNELFKGMIENQVDLEDSNNKQLFNYIFNTKSASPIYFSDDKNYIVTSQIKIEDLCIDFNDFQELFEEEINVVLLVERKYSEEQEIILLDFMKDVFKISRDLRRKMNVVEQEKLIIKEKGPAIKGEVLYMYN